MGRRRELASFDDALEGRSSRRVLLVHGPGGIGKTTLLLELRTRGRDVGRAVVLLDAGRSTRRPRGSSTPSWPPSANRPAGPWLATWPGPSCWSTATSSSARSTAGCARRSCPPCPPTPWSSWPAATSRHRPGAPTRAGAHWSPSVVSTTSTRPRATSCSPSPGSPRRSAPTWCGSVAATRWPWPCSRCRGHRHGPRQPRRGPRSCLGPAGDAAAGRAQRRHMSGLAACATAWLTTEDLLRKVVGADAPAVWGLAGTAAVHRQRAPRALAPRPGQGRAGRRVRAPLAGV